METCTADKTNGVAVLANPTIDLLDVDLMDVILQIYRQARFR